MDVVRVKEFKFRPIEEEGNNIISTPTECHQRLHSNTHSNTKCGVWNSDGEVLYTPSIHIR